MCSHHAAVHFELSALRRPEYDVYSTDTLRAELQALTGSAILEFSDVRYFDSTSIGALIHHLKMVRERVPNASFVLRNMNPPLRRIFEITGLIGIFPIE